MAELAHPTLETAITAYQDGLLHANRFADSGHNAAHHLQKAQLILLRAQALLALLPPAVRSQESCIVWASLIAEALANANQFVR